MQRQSSVKAARQGDERRERTRVWGCPSQRSCRRSRWRWASATPQPGLRKMRLGVRSSRAHVPGRTPGARTGGVVRREAEAGEEREVDEGGLRRRCGERQRCGEGRQGQPACDSAAHSALHPRPTGCAAARRAGSGRRRGAEHGLASAPSVPALPQAAGRGARPLARMTRAQDTDTCRGVPGALLCEPRPPPPPHHHHFGWAGHPHARSDGTCDEKYHALRRRTAADG